LIAVGRDFGWSRTIISTMPLITGMTAALLSPLYGGLMDRIGSRRVLLPGLIGYAAALMAISIVPQVTWLFFAIYLALGILVGSQAPAGYNKVICQWFVRSRGAAMAIVAATSASVGYALMPQVANYLVVHYDWRTAYFCLGMAILLLSFPINYWFLRERHGPSVNIGKAIDAPPADEGMTQSHGQKTLSFWKLWISLFLAANIYYGVMLHLFPMMLDRGIDRFTATSAISAIAIGAVGGQLAAAALLDRVNTPKIGMLFFLIGFCGVLQIHLGTSPTEFRIGAIMVGVGQGAELSVIAYITSRLFGLRAFGGLCSMIYAGAAVATGTGPLIMGYCYDRFGSYRAAFLAGEIGLIVALLLIFTLPPYVFGGKTSQAKSV